MVNANSNFLLFTFLNSSEGGLFFCLRLHEIFWSLYSKTKQIWDPSAAEELAVPPGGKEHPYKTNNHLRQGGVFEELWPFSGENYIFIAGF